MDFLIHILLKQYMTKFITSILFALARQLAMPSIRQHVMIRL